MELSQINISNVRVAAYERADGRVARLPQLLIDRLKLWNPNLDESQLKVIAFQYEIWTDGSLGAPMPGECYTQALVPGFRIVLELGNERFEVHTNYDQNIFAIPGYGFI